jgi:ABC-type antimicrobial peptide transport system permease subunit
VCFASDGLAAGSNSTSRLFARGEGILSRQGQYQYLVVGPGYFHTTGISLLRGRGFEALDIQNNTKVVIVSQSFARRVYGHEAVLGYRIGTSPQSQAEDLRIIGVAADARINGLKEEPPPIVYLPKKAWSQAMPVGELLIRLQPGGPEPRKELHKALSETEPGLVFSPLQDLNERLLLGIRVDLNGAQLAWLFAGGALVISLTGMTTLSSYVVSQRRHERAIRLALGEPRSHQHRALLLENLALAVAGICGGLLVAWCIQAFPCLGSRLPGTLNPAAAGLAGLCCLLSCLAASVAPALRAARTDPSRLLRGE